MKPFFLASALLVLGCAGRPGGHVFSSSAQEQGDARVGQYLSSQWSFNTSSFWIEGPEGLVLIDTQFLPTALHKERVYAEQKTGKKAKLAIVLHSNPDRFNGTAYLKGLGISVVTSDQVRSLLPGVHQKWAPVFFEKYWVSQYPREVVLPEAFGSRTRELTAGGVTVKAHVLGKGCSEAHVVVEWGGHLFVGDLVGNGAHGWFEQGRIDEWLERLDELRALRPRWIHPGHGLTGGPELLDRQTDYLRTVIAAVVREKPHGAPASDALARITDEVTHRHPDRSHTFFLKRLLQAEWARQVVEAIRTGSPAERAAAPPPP